MIPTLPDKRSNAATEKCYVYMFYTFIAHSFVIAYKQLFFAVIKTFDAEAIMHRHSL